MSFGGGGSGSGSISSSSDVALSNPSNGQVLTYNSTLGKWQNSTNPSAPVSSVNGQTGAVVLAKGDVGLGNVDNTSDATKNVAAATLTNKDLTSGTNSFPTFNQDTSGNAASATKLATARTINGVAFDGTASITVADSTKVPTTTTVNGHALSANVTLSAADVGLGNVTNTSDANKPVSTAQAAAIDAKSSAAVYSGSAWPARPTATYVTWIDTTGSAPTPSDIQTGDVVIKKS